MFSSSKLITAALAFLSIFSGAALGDERADDLIKQGSVYDEKFQPEEALDYYLEAEKLEPDNVGLLLRIARQYRHLMQDASGTEEKLRLGEIAKKYAARAVELAPNEAEAHLSVAISYSKMVPILGTRERLESSRKIKTAVDKALALDPKKDLAWNILGCWHQRLADIGMTKRAIAVVIYGGVPAASNEESVKCFKKAIALNPNNLIHHIEMGRTYAQMGKAEEARKCIEKGISMPNVGKDDPEAKKRGKETLESLK